MYDLSCEYKVIQINEYLIHRESKWQNNKLTELTFN